MLHLHMEEGLAILEMRHAKKGNPFSFGMTRELIRHCHELESDPHVQGVMIWGGVDRSFSVGGDFKDVKSLTTVEQATGYLREIVQSYQAVLSLTKPLVCAIDHFAIGQGLQVALLGDRRIGSARSTYHMPELVNGVACPLGSALLEAMLGRAAMLELVIGCPSLDAQEAKAYRIIDQVLEPEADLRQAAVDALRTLVGYVQLPYRETKRIHNRRLVAVLEDVMEDAAAAHAACMMQNSGEAHFKRILGNRA
ncbi:MAG: enoyl-CoA hydratase/isomerase family protein [Planctomycetota bacterium]|jgi:carboxymethylproline synthase